MTRLSNIFFQRIPKILKQQPDPPRPLRILMHGKPHFQIEVDLITKQPNQLRHSRGNLGLTTPNAHSGAQRRQLCRIVVTTKTELLPAERGSLPAD